MPIITTPIDGLKISLNKVIADQRGILCELAPKGTNNEFLKDGVGNIYTSIAIGKYTSRAEHYHYRLVENFYTLTGTALWLFKDFRENSITKNNIYSVILGEQRFSNPQGIESYTIDHGYMAQTLVPAGVYHAYYVLSEERVMVLAIASTPHDDTDYVKIKIADIKELQEIISRIIPGAK